jgi:hypothetical protein
MRLKRGYLVVGVLGVALIVVFVLASLKEEGPSPSLPRVKSYAVEKAGPSWAYPDPTRTPGSVNPTITEANIAETICNPEWTTKSIRPPESYTSRLKHEQIRDWGLPGSASDYEEDHLISLELGGSPTDPRNLWPESYSPKPGAKEKDVVENYLHRQVCAGALTLTEAQEAIATDWYKVYLKIRR